MKKLLSVILTAVMLLQTVAFAVPSAVDVVDSSKELLTSEETPIHAEDDVEEYEIGDTCHDMIRKWFSKKEPVLMSESLDKSVLNLIEDYFDIRLDSLICVEDVKNDTLTNNIAHTETLRRLGLKNHWNELNIFVTDADHNIRIDKFDVDVNGNYTIYAYEWVFYDYDDLDFDGTAINVSGFGVEHILQIENNNGTYIIAGDKYDERNSSGICTIEIDTSTVEEYANDSVLLIQEDTSELFATNYYEAYDVSAAVDYADKYALNYNPNYYDYTSAGGDCANFVSQCITAGGMPHVSGSFGQTANCWYYKSGNRSGTWTVAPYLRIYMAQYRGLQIVSPSLNQMYAGSPFFVTGAEGGADGHACICVGFNAEGSALYSAHTSDVWRGKVNIASVNYIVQLTPSNETIPPPSETDYTYTATDSSTGHTYSSYNYVCTWEKAKELCESFGGHLATITSSNEQAIVSNLASSANRACWIGAYRPDASTKTYQWVTGENFGYTNWDTNEPSYNSGSNNELYVGIYGNDTDSQYATTGKWNDFSSGTSTIRGFICEWESKEYTISFDANGGTNPPASQVKTHGENIYLSSQIPVRQGFTFLGWAGSPTGAVEIMPGGLCTYNYNLTLYAVWGENRPGKPYIDSIESDFYVDSDIVLTWDPVNEYCDYYEVHVVNSNDEHVYVDWGVNDTTHVFSLSAPGTYSVFITAINEELVNIGNYATSSSKANFTINERKEHTVYFNANGGTVSQTSKVVTNGEKYGELPRPTRPGHTFAGWYTSSTYETEIESDSIVSLTSNQMLYAKWIANTLSYDVNGGTDGPSDSQKSDIEGKTTLSNIIPVKDGYVFKGWGIYTYSDMEIYSPGETVILPLTNTIACAIWYDESNPAQKVITFTDNKEAEDYQYHFVSGYKVQTDYKPTYENGAINGVVPQNEGNHYDPIVAIPSLYFSANSYNYITINAKIDIEGTDKNGMQIFFTTDKDTVFSESKSAWSWYSPEDENGYRDFTFEMSLNKDWNGTITSLRIDPFNDVPGSYSINSVTLTYKSPDESKTSIKLDKTLLDIKHGEKATIKATTNPDDMKITWISTNEDVATVKDGVVTAVGAGSAAIIAKTYDEAAVEYVSGEIYTTDNPAYVSSTKPIQVVENPFDENDKVLYLETSESDRQAWSYFWHPCEYVPGQKYLIKFRVLPGNDYYGNKVNFASFGINIHTDGKDKGVAWKQVDYDEWTEIACVYTIPENIDVAKNMKFGIFANPSEVGDSEQSVSYSYYLDDVMVIPYDGEYEDGLYDWDDEKLVDCAAGCLVKVEAEYTINYNANGGTNAPASQTKTHDVALTLSSAKPTRDGYTFLGWSTTENGSVEYASGATYTANSAVTLYAVWELDTVSVSGVSLNKINATLKEGETLTLTATVSPSDATNKEVTWKSSNTSVATVENGVVTAEGEGTAAITVTTRDGGYTATCEITVEPVIPDEPDTPVDYKATMTLSDVSGKPGDTVKVVVSLKTDERINTIGLRDITYDTSVLTFTGFSDYEELQNLCQLSQFDEEKIAVVAALKNAQLFDGEICTLNFKINENAQEGDVAVSAVASIKLNSDVVATQVVPATVGVTLQMLGDIDLNDSVDMNDAILLLQHSMFSDLYPIGYKGSVDFTKDGNVDMNDAILLLQYSMFPDLYPIN